MNRKKMLWSAGTTSSCAFDACLVHCRRRATSVLFNFLLNVTARHLDW